jgi:hypothetical protein
VKNIESLSNGGNATLIDSQLSSLNLKTPLVLVEIAENEYSRGSTLNIDRSEASS